MSESVLTNDDGNREPPKTAVGTAMYDPKPTTGEIVKAIKGMTTSEVTELRKALKEEFFLLVDRRSYKRGRGRR